MLPWVDSHLCVCGWGKRLSTPGSAAWVTSSEHRVASTGPSGYAGLCVCSRGWQAGWRCLPPTRGAAGWVTPSPGKLHGCLGWAPGMSHLCRAVCALGWVPVGATLCVRKAPPGVGSLCCAPSTTIQLRRMAYRRYVMHQLPSLSTHACVNGFPGCGPGCPAGQPKRWYPPCFTAGGVALAQRLVAPPSPYLHTFSCAAAGAAGLAMLVCWLLSPAAGASRASGKGSCPQLCRFYLFFPWPLQMLCSPCNVGVTAPRRCPQPPLLNECAAGTGGRGDGRRGFALSPDHPRSHHNPDTAGMLCTRASPG
jgi:hypothetical protein